ncbi:hypothetical protein WICPIJ_003881 [Wickerhamomyces pijperi]|uniref:Major facilitator superfamily (MFS) profile domain-containing protein n=1 Tax=Wickerhamomyces pijperi TaxID=599730 RepID=A0A9P8TNF3_WICPI|nr:hypothetical protein WICPIJ_003881 [Wickerhamomyces pijperi]
MTSINKEKIVRTEHLENANSAGGILNSEDEFIDTHPHDDELFEQAKLGTEDEHSLTLKDAIKYHMPAILWSMLFSATIIMEGYDNSLIGSFYAYPSFARKYGSYNAVSGDYQLSGPWQVGLGCASAAGSIVGVICNGYMTEKWGHRHVILVSLIIMAACIFITFFAQNVGTLVAGQVLSGLPWGVFATVGSQFSSEVVPLKLRGYLAAYINICWATGQLIAAGVLQGFINYGNDDITGKGQWSYRIPFALQWMFIPPLFILTWLAPDSPQWLIRKGKIDAAYKSLKRLSNHKIHDKIPSRLAMMRHTNNLEKQAHNDLKDETALQGFKKCFQGVNLRRTEIGCFAFSAQVLSGSTFAYSPSYFFSQAGLASGDTYKLNLGVTGIAWVGTTLSWVLLSRFGRRTIFLTGYTLLVIMLLLIGILACPTQTSGIKWAQAGITMVWVAVYSLTIGPGAFIFSVEASSTILRPQSVALARGYYTLWSLISNIVEPYLINPGNANLKGKTAFVWLGTAVCIWVWAVFRLPETKDRTYEELDILFNKQVPAWKFSSYKIDVVTETPALQEKYEAEAAQEEQSE